MSKFYYKETGQTVQSKCDFPTGEHLAVIEFGSSSYQESYGNHDGRLETTTVNYIRYRWWFTEDREHWLAFIKDQLTPKYSSPKDIIVLDCGKRVEPKITIQI